MNKYQLRLPGGDFIEVQCKQFELRKKVSEKVKNIPYDQIILLDKENQLFNPNKFLAETQLYQGQAQIQYKVLDLQKTIKEWVNQSQYLQNYRQKDQESIAKIQKLEQELKQIKDYINKMESEKQSQSSQYATLQKQKNEEIQSLNNELTESKNKYISDIQNLQKQMANDKQDFDQAIMNLENTKKDKEEQLQQVIAQNQQQINQLMIESQNTIQQEQQKQEQIQAYFQQYLQNYQYETQNYYNNQFQIKDAEYQEQIKNIEEKYKQELNLKKQQAKQSEAKQEEIITALQQDLLKEKLTVQKQERRITTLQNQLNEIEQDKKNTEQFGASVNQQVQNLSKELSKKRTELQNIIFEKEQLQAQLEDLKIFSKQQQEKTDKNYQATIADLEVEMKTKDDNNKKIQSDLDTQLQNNKELSLKLKEKESTVEQLNRDNAYMRQEIENKNNTGNNLNQEKKRIDQEKQQLKNELDSMTGQYEQIKKQFRELELENKNLKGQIAQKEIEHTALTTKYNESERQKNQYSEQFKKMTEEFQIGQQLQQKESEKLIIQVQVAESKIERVIQNFGESKIYEKLTSPLEKIMQSQFKINKFNEDPNYQADKTKYNLYEISLDNNKFNEYVKQGKFFMIDECFLYTDKKQISGQRSIQASAESEFYKGYLIRIEESQEEILKGKTLLRKDLKLQAIASVKKEDAARLANNNIFCAWLQQQFNIDLANAKLQTMGQRIQRQFILENQEKKEFYYCELVEEGEYKKINGGKFVPQKEDIHQYFNAFSLYSHHYFQRELMITNFQICGNYIHDMIVNTNHKGLFSPLDQGASEYLSFNDIMTKQPVDIVAKCWNDNLKNSATHALVK